MTKKKKKEKVSTIQEVRADINPQLCKVYNPAKHNWSHSWLAEPKFDGLRCNIVVEVSGEATAYSRNGKPLWNMGKILKEIELTTYEYEVHNKFWGGLVLDGEVYTKDWNLSMSIVKRSTQTHPDQDKLRYNVFDCLMLKEWKNGKSSVPNFDRKKRLDIYFDCEYTETVRGIPVKNDEELQYAYQEFLRNGFEGAVLKDPNGPYECGRKSPYWLKVKPWSDADLTVVGSYPGEGKHLGRIGGLVVEGAVEWHDKSYSVRTEVGTGFTDEERVLFQTLQDEGKLSGRIVEVKFQSIAEDTGACRFPVYSRLRTDRE